MYYYHDSVKYFCPDDTDTILWIRGNVWSIADIIQRCKNKWGDGFDIEKCTVSAENIQVSCIGNDWHDYSDYEDFICVTLDT